MRRSGIALALLALVLSACGSKLTPAQQRAAAASASAQAKSGARASAAKNADAPSRVATQSGPIAAKKPSNPTVKVNDFPLAMHLNTACATPGSKMQAMVVTVPASQLAFASYYTADNSYTPDIAMVPSESNVSGSFTWTWILKPTTPLGQAVVKVLAAKNQKAASATGYFRVARTC